MYGQPIIKICDTVRLHNTIKVCIRYGYVTQYEYMIHMRYCCLTRCNIWWWIGSYVRQYKYVTQKKCPYLTQYKYTNK